MAVSLNHKFVSAIPDGTDATVVRPSNWNDQHNLTGTASTLLGFDGTGEAQEISVGATLAYSGSNLSLANGINDTEFTLQDNLDNTKKAVFQCSGINTGTTYTYSFPATSGIFIMDVGTQNMSGSKTFSNTLLGFGSATATSVCNVAYGANASGVTKTVNIGTAGLSGSTTNINIGSAISGALGTTTINQAVVLNNTIQMKSYTIATLPTAGTAGRRAYVTDALAPTFLGTLTAGGAVRTPVFDNGTAWVAG